MTFIIEIGCIFDRIYTAILPLNMMCPMQLVEKKPTTTTTKKTKEFLKSSRECYFAPTGVFELSWLAPFGGIAVHPSDKELKRLLQKGYVTKHLQNKCNLNE